MTETRIIIAEDESLVARDIARSLKKFGYRVIGVVDRGEDVLAYSGDTSPDLVLMDIMLKGDVDGITAAEGLREKGVPVIFLTAHSDNNTLNRAKLSEPYGYILKPFEDKELHTAIEMALYKHKMEMKIRESEARFRSVFETAREAVVVTDEEGIILNWNLAAERMFGRKRVEAVGQDILMLFPKRFSRVYAEGKGKVLLALAQEDNSACEKSILFEMPGVGGGGSELSLELSMSAWISDNRRFLTHLISDISLRKKAEGEKERLIMDMQEALARANPAYKATDIDGGQ